MMTLLRAGVIWALMAVPCFAEDIHTKIKKAGDVCILKADVESGWIAVHPFDLEMWVHPDKMYASVPTNRPGAVIVICIEWKTKDIHRHIVTVEVDTPPPVPVPVPDPVVPVPPVPPGPVVVPNKYGLGEVSYREMLKIAGNVGQPTMVSSLDTCAAELAGVTSVQQRDEAYARHRARMDAGLGQEWMPIRKAVQAAMFQSFAEGKIKTFTDESAGVKEVADAIRLVK